MTSFEWPTPVCTFPSAREEIWFRRRRNLLRARPCPPAPADFAYIEGFLQRERSGPEQLEELTSTLQKLCGDEGSNLPLLKESIESLSRAAESRELRTAGHGDLVARYTEVIARGLGLLPGRNRRSGMRLRSMTWHRVRPHPQQAGPAQRRGLHAGTTARARGRGDRWHHSSQRHDAGRHRTSPPALRRFRYPDGLRAKKPANGRASSL